MISPATLQIYAREAGFLLEQNNVTQEVAVTTGEAYDVTKQLTGLVARIEKLVRQETYMRAVDICRGNAAVPDDLAMKCAKDIREYEKRQK